MQYIVTPQQMQEIDKSIIDMHAGHSLLLMENAANAVLNVVLSELTEGCAVGIFAGSGNNGGDGLALARMLIMRGINAWVALLCDPNTLKGDARKQYDILVNCGVAPFIVRTDKDIALLPTEEVSIIVDSLFGTGLNRDVGGIYKYAIECINSCGKKVIAVDIPSGIDGGSGKILGAAVRADITVTFQHKKIGHMLHPGREYSGNIIVSPIGITEDKVYTAEEFEYANIERIVKKRPQSSHKAQFGRALLLAGSKRYPGAAILSATAAQRMGAGLLYAAVPQAIHSAFINACPSIIASAISEDEWDNASARNCKDLFEGKTACAIGPGMGEGAGVPLLLEHALKTRIPLIIDADGINALAKSPALLKLLHEGVILTPHPGEMARLTGKPAGEIGDDPMFYASYYSNEWDCTVLLKGTTTVIASGGKICFNVTGNAGLAKGGSGDVLAGIILSLLAEGLTPYEAGAAGAYILGASATEALQILGERLLVHNDILDFLLGQPSKIN